MYKYFSRIALLFVVLGQLLNSAHAYSDVAPGIQLGDPSGFTFKSYSDEKKALDLGLSYSFSSFMIIYGDMLYQWPIHGIWGKSKAPTYPLYFYLGMGGVIFISTDSTRRDGKFYTNSGDSLGLGIRIPFGLEKRIDSTPFAVYIEIAPGIGVIPSTFGFAQFGIGGRFHL